MLIFNGDIVDDHDITVQVARHEAARADATLYLTRVERDLGTPEWYVQGTEAAAIVTTCQREPSRFRRCEASDLRVGTVQTETLEQTSGCAVKTPR